MNKADTFISIIFLGVGFQDSRSTCECCQVNATTRSENSAFLGPGPENGNTALVWCRKGVLEFWFRTEESRLSTLFQDPMLDLPHQAQ